MGVDWSEVAQKSNGGTELQGRALESLVPKELLDQFQIVPSRLRRLDENKIRVFWCHDLPNDPEAENALGNGGWQRFHKIVFVSNWQQMLYIEKFGIPYSRCVVLKNAIRPIEFPPTSNSDVNGPVRREDRRSKDEPVRLIYTSTPHRGLAILAPVFKKLKEQFPQVELDVFSSFGIYGWPENDKPFEGLFKELSEMPGVTYHGSQPNDVVRARLAESDIFAYPSVWPETSCLCLMEAMSAGLICVHPNFGALWETAANWTAMYQWHEDPQKHASMFFKVLSEGVGATLEGRMEGILAGQRNYANLFYGWNTRAIEWISVLEELKEQVKDTKFDPEANEPTFTYRVS